MSRFEKNARVNLPALGDSTFRGAQAVVIDLTETIPGFPVYTVRWLDDAGETHTGTCGEGDLHDANCSIEFQPRVDVIDAPRTRVLVFADPKKRKRKPAKKSAAKRRR